MPTLDPDGVFQAGTFDEETSLAWRNVVAIAPAAGFSQASTLDTIWGYR